jgi:hypothetical protein
MFKTEAQAAEAWCPERVKAEFPEHCAGPGCMMWRWATPPAYRRVSIPPRLEDAMSEAEPTRPESVCETWKWSPPDADPGCWVEPEEEAAARRTGYCGLAGKPEF